MSTSSAAGRRARLLKRAVVGVALASAVAAFAAVLPAAAAATCAASKGPVVCETCPTGADVNVMSNLPRVGRAGAGASSNWADYDLLSCNASSTSMCSFSISTSGLTGEISGGPKSSKSFVAYVEGVVAYAAFAILAALFCIVVSLFYCCGRCCCGRCLCACCCKGGCCGKRYPTYAMSSCRLGFAEVDAPLLSKAGTKVLAYPGRARWATRICMLVYVGGVMAFISLGQLRGSQGITSSLKTVAKSPASAMNLVVKSKAPLTNAIIAMSADMLYPLLRDVHSTVMTTINVPGLIADARCITHGLRYDLPDLNAIYTFVNDSVATINTVRGATNSLQGNLGSITGALNTVLGYTDTLEGNLTALYSGVVTVNSSIAGLGGDMSSLSTSLSTINASIVPAAAGLAATVAHLPTEAAANDVHSGTNSLNTLTGGVTMDGSGATERAARASLAARMTSLLANFTAVPNLDTLATQLDGLSTAITDLRSAGTINSLDAKLAGTRSALDALPTVAALNATLNGVRSALTGINVAGIRSTLLLFQDVLDHRLPNVSIVLGEFDKIARLSTMLDCVFDAMALARAVNVSLVSLPDAYNSAVSMVRDVNSTVSTASSQVTSYRSQLGSLTNISASLPNITHYIALVDVVAAQAANPPIDFSAIDAAMASSASAQAGVDIPGMRASLAAVNASLWSSNVIAPPAMLTALRAMQTVVTSTRGAVDAALDRFGAFMTARCDAPSYTPCSPGDGAPNAACGGSVCSSGTRTCALDYTVACTQDSDCSAAGSICLYSAPHFAAAANALGVYTSATPDTFAANLVPVSASVGAANTAVAATPPLSGLSSTLAAAQAGLGAIPINSSLTLLGTLRGQVDPNTLGLGAVNDSVAAATATLTSFDMSGVLNQVGSAKDTVDSMLSQVTSYLDRADRGIDSFQYLMYVTLPTLLPRMGRPSLAAKQEAGGIVAVIRELVDVGQVLVDQAAYALNGTFSFSMNLTASVDPYMPYVRQYANANNTMHGPAYYFYNLVPGAKSVPPEEVAAAGGGTVFQSASGAVWSGSRMCVTTECIDATIDKLNKEKLEITPATFGSTSSSGATISLPLSREQIMFLPFLIPLLIALLGFCGAVGLCGKSWQSCPACFSALCICAALPLIFLFAGAFTFPMVMVMSDACRSAFNVGYTFVAGSEGALCAMMPQGALVPTATGTACRTTPVANVTLEVPVARIYSALLGQCATYPTAVSDLLSQVDTQVGSYAGRTINTTLDDAVGGGLMGISLRPPLMAILRAVGTHSTGVVHSITTDLADTFTCEVVNRAVTDVTNSVCCDMMTSIYWFVSSWYFIAFFMCICGCPASIWGYKRFPNKLWGPDYDLRSKASDGGAVVDATMAGADALAAGVDASLVAGAADGGAENAAATGAASAPGSPATNTTAASHASVVAVQPRLDGGMGPGIELAPMAAAPGVGVPMQPPALVMPPVMPMYGGYDAMMPPVPGPMLLSPGGGYMASMLPPHMMAPMGGGMMMPVNRGPAYSLPPAGAGGRPLPPGPAPGNMPVAATGARPLPPGPVPTK